MSVRYETSSVEATRELGVALAAVLSPGDLLVLAGDMGAGKTALTQGLARGLGITDQVTSPTFTLLRHYEGRHPLHHVDVYRLGRLHEVQDLGLPELLDGPGITVIEWGDMVAAMLPADYLEVRLSYGEGDDDRLLELRAVGSRWAARQRVLGETLEAWAC